MDRRQERPQEWNTEVKGKVKDKASDGVSEEKEIELDIREEVSKGSRKPRTLRGPGTPIPLPNMSWCPHVWAGAHGIAITTCVRDKGITST